MSAVTAPHPAVSAFNLRAVLSQPHPSIPLQPKPLLHSLVAFQAAVDAYVHKGKQEIARRKDAHLARVKEDAERKRELEQSIETEKRREIDLIEVLEKEKQETKEMEASIHLLKKQLGSLTEFSTALDGEASDLRARMSRLRKDKERDLALLEERAHSTSPELALYERALGLTVTGVKEDVLLFKFTQLDEQSPERVFSFVLDVSHADYAVPMSEPALGRMGELVKELNATRDVWCFVKGVRRGYVDELGARR